MVFELPVPLGWGWGIRVRRGNTGEKSAYTIMNKNSLDNLSK